MFGKKPYNYKEEGSVRKDGYIRLTIDKARVLYHRVLIEKSIGRKLSKDEIVHHIDGNNQNNSLDNLEVMAQKQHIELHRELLNTSRGRNL